MTKIKIFLSILLVSMLSSCNDMHDIDPKREPINTTETGKMLILSEGLFNLNNSNLTLYDFEAKTLSTHYFLDNNKRGLGDTANDMCLYGGKLYIVVNVSSQIEVLNPYTGKVLKQIPMFNEKGIARQPRYAIGHKDKVYVTAFDGTLSQIDTTSLKIEAMVKCGRNPEGLCVANNKIYVANSGGLDFPNYDSTLSVVQIDPFKELKKIDIAINPYKVFADSEGDVYVSSRGNYGDKPYRFQRIDSYIDTVVQDYPDLNVLNFTIKDDRAYLYNYDFFKKKSWVKVLNCISEEVVDTNFVKDENIDIQTPYSIHTNPYNDNIYISNAFSFTVWGDFYCFDKRGNFQYRLTEVGLNPNTVVFLP